MILFHAICGILALVSGLGVIGLRKGSPTHVMVGRVYGLSMFILCTSSFFIYELFGAFGAFHIMSMVSLASVIMGVVLAWRKKKGWLRGHYMSMLYSYVGLIMATGSHFFRDLGMALYATGLSRLTVWILCALILWVIPYVIGSYLIRAYWPHFQKEFQQNYA